MRPNRLLSCLAAMILPMAAPLLRAESAILAQELLQHTRVLASDEFEGRAPGTPGEEKTVQYLTDQFRALGLKPAGHGGSWTQDVPIVGIRSEVDFLLDGQALGRPQDFVAWSPENGPLVEVPTTEMVFVGYGVHAPEYGWDDFKGVDVKGKTVVILVGDPPVPAPGKAGGLDPAMFKGEAMTYYGRWTYKFEEAGRRGAAAALIIHETKPAAYPWFVVVNSWGRERFDLEDDTSPRSRIAGWISLERAQALLAANGTSYEAMKATAVRKSFRPVPLKQKAAYASRQNRRTVKSRNVLGLLEGREVSKRDEWVVYSSHWDHLGRDPKIPGDGIYNGAADNAIGVAGLLELAERFARDGKRPRRSLLFLSVTAEEQGLLGSAYYAANPVHPLQRTLANINMDGLNQWGRTRDVRVVGFGSSTLEDVLSREARRQGRVTLPETHPERGTFYRSDHFEFMKRGVPGLYAKSGIDYRDKPAGYGEGKVNEYIDRDYHKVSDEVKADWDLSGAVEDLELLHAVGWRIAEDRRWPEWRKGAEFRAARIESLRSAPATR
jgi:Zn-dependent M28 family amino/carboxypeptidase